MSRLTKKNITGIVFAVVIFAGLLVFLLFAEISEYQSAVRDSVMVEAVISDVETVKAINREGDGKIARHYAYADFTAPDGTVYTNQKIGAVHFYTKAGDTVKLYINEATGELYIVERFSIFGSAGSERLDVN